LISNIEGNQSDKLEIGGEAAVIEGNQSDKNILA